MRLLTNGRKLLGIPAMLAACHRLRRFRVGSTGSTGGAARVISPSEDGKIDVAYLWRDAHDKGWISAHTEALTALDDSELALCNRPDLRCLEVQREGAKLDLLRWSLRSLTRNFEALGRVHIVSDTPPPLWLDAGHPRLVWHAVREVVADTCPYPTFSSQAIESFLYRLPGLSERFIYMNDDFFFSQPVGEDAFFRGENILVRFGRGASPVGAPDTSEPGDSSAHKNSNRLLDMHFGRERRLTLKHRPYALTQSLYAEAEKRFAEALAATRRHRFRSTRTFALHSCLVPYFALYQNKAHAFLPELFAKDMMHWSNDLAKNEKVYREVISAGRNDVGFCVQANGELSFSIEARNQFECLMEGVFPQRGIFEKSAMI